MLIALETSAPLFAKYDEEEKLVVYMRTTSESAWTPNPPPQNRNAKDKPTCLLTRNYYQRSIHPRAITIT